MENPSFCTVQRSVHLDNIQVGYDTSVTSGIVDSGVLPLSNGMIYTLPQLSGSHLVPCPYLPYA